MKIRDSWNAAFTKVEALDASKLIRLSLFVIYVWFGAVKLLGLSQASPLAQALTSNTIGGEYFAAAFTTLAIIECLIGLLFLLPRFTRFTVLIALLHMLVVSSPLLLVPGLSWQGLLVPTLEGQYIIKNLALASLMLALLTNSGTEQS